MIDFTELPEDGVRFEQFVRELLMRSGFKVHWTGVGPDSGRDLVIYEEAVGALAPFQRKWLVSCKHNAKSGKSVGIGDVSGITDECEAVGATGYLLACSTQPSSAVVKRFEEIEAQGKLIVRFWDGVELENRTSTPDAFALNHLFFPKSTKDSPWKIFATQIPSFWVANYKDYLLYMSSRTANSFPKLQDVEEIVKRLEAIDLPAGQDWERHVIRPRAVYFDNKNEVFSVFADYIFPKGEISKVMHPTKLDEVLQDGACLYSEEGKGGWYTTHWDVRYVSEAQGSDHFHLDHKKHYTPYMENFKIGYPRGGFISEMASIPAVL